MRELRSNPLPPARLGAASSSISMLSPPRLGIISRNSFGSHLARFEPAAAPMGGPWGKTTFLSTFSCFFLYACIHTGSNVISRWVKRMLYAMSLL